MKTQNYDELLDMFNELKTKYINLELKLKAKEIERLTKIQDEKKKEEDTSFNKIDTQ